MSTILLFGAGKSSTCLISYLVEQAPGHDWQVIVADADLSQAQSKIGANAGQRAKAIAVRVEDDQAREDLIRQADIVISLLPPALHFLVASSCIACQKNLLTASYLDEKIKTLEPAIRKNGLLFLCEMGLDPGIDHMSAMQLIHRIRERQGRITAFRSHTGGLIAPESDDNPWHYKISWNPRNVVMAGSAGAQFKQHDRVITRRYEELFENNEEVSLPAMWNLAWYPNRDSLAYIPIYGLEEAETFIRTTLRYPVFCRAWNSVVRAGLTNHQLPLRMPATGSTFREWSAPILPFINPDNKVLFEFLGLFNDDPLPAGAGSSADVLQFLLETKLAMRPQDKDMIVMLHEIGYETPDAKHAVTSSLVVKGEDHLRTAMAKTVGLPLGIAAKLILEKKIRLTGLHIPVSPAIYEPVLQELAGQGIRFDEKFS